MRSGDESGDLVDLPGLVAKLGPGRNVALFAMNCAERLSVVVESLCQSTAIVEAVQSALGLGWASLNDVAPGRESQITAARSELESVIEVSGDKLGKYHGYIHDAVAAADSALEAVAVKSEAAAANAADLCYEAYFRAASEVWPTMDFDAVSSSPIMQEEAKRLRDLAQDIIDHQNDPMEPLARRLRAAARQQGAELVDLICGRAPKSKPKQDQQDSLF